MEREREREGSKKRRENFWIYRWMDLIPGRRWEQRGIEAEKKGGPNARRSDLGGEEATARTARHCDEATRDI